MGLRVQNYGWTDEETAENNAVYIQN